MYMCVSSLLQAEMNSNHLKAQGSMMAAVACASVPKITVVIGGCHGADSYAMVRGSVCKYYGSDLKARIPSSGFSPARI